MFELINVSTPVIINKELDKATRDIIALNNSIVRNDYHIAFIMAQVDESECYKEDGFKNVTDWAVKCFDFKKTRCYDYIKVGREFIREVISKKGKVTGYCSNLLPIPLVDDAENASPAPEKDFTVSQIAELTRIGHDNSLELVNKGNLTPDMTCAEIRKVVDKFKSSQNDEDGNTGVSEDVGHTETKVKKTKDLSKVETADLINELIKRGFRVTDNDGHVWEGE